MPEGIKDFKDLVVWQKSIRLAKFVYQATAEFLKDERNSPYDRESSSETAQ
jgi:hypothetical protein